ncbi:MAG: glycerophosphodiester phosphodiesterase [Anaerolineae bacterium]
MGRGARLMAGAVAGAALGVGSIIAHEYATWRPRRLESIYSRRPLLLGHRGAAAEAPENTLVSFRRALEVGAAGVELDVHLTRDGQVVVIHDDTLARVAGVVKRVRDLTLAQVQSLDAGAWFGREYAGVRIPSLAEALAAMGPQALVNIELKGTRLAADGLEREVARVVRIHNAGSRVICSSFNPVRLWRLRVVAPELARGLLHAPDLPALLRGLWLLPLAQPDALHPHHSQVTRCYMTRARRWGVRVNAWTVDDADEAWRLVALGVDGIISNDPRSIVAAGLIR